MSARESHDFGRGRDVNEVAFRVGAVMVALLVGLAVVGLLLKVVPRRLPPIRLPHVGRDAAVGMVTDVLWAAADARFGFPTGFFAVDEAVSSADLVVAREQTFWSSNASNLATVAFHGPVAWGERNGTPGLGIAVAVAASVVALPVAVWAVAAEYLMRFLLRSDITAALTDLDDEFGTSVQLRLRGPSARLASKQIRAAFREPSLPSKVAAKAGLKHRSRRTKEPSRA